MHRTAAVLLSAIVFLSLLAVGLAPAGAASTARPLIVVYMENKGLSGVTGTAGQAAMPYLNSLWHDPASQQFTAWYAVAHPSFPNYAAMASGQTPANTDAVTAGEFALPTVWDQLQAAGISWGVFEESMPKACATTSWYNDTTAPPTGVYKIGHNPAVAFAGVYDSSECANVQPLSAMNLSALPAVSFVTPNLCDDMHGVTAAQAAEYGYQNCVTGTTAISTQGDQWLAARVPQWTAAGADVLITFDEGTGTASSPTSATGGGGQVYAVLTGPGVQGGQDAAPMSHYSILAGIEDAYGLPLLGNAATAAPLALPGATTVSGPSVVITSPAPGATVSSPVSVSGTAAENGGTISGVQVSADGGTPVAATGTAQWTASLPGLAAGQHTITATATDSTGATASTSETVTVAAPSACPALAPGETELSGNVSLETGQAGWTGIYNASSAATRVQPPGGSYDGAWALQVALKPGTSGSAGLANANPLWVPSVTAGQSYTASAYVRASAATAKVTLVLREENSSGATVGSHATTITPGTSWAPVSTAYTAAVTGDSLHYLAYSPNLTSSGTFLADCLSLQTP